METMRRPCSASAAAQMSTDDKLMQNYGSGADEDGAVWQPIPPSGYDPPGTTTIMCIWGDCTTNGTIGSLIWNDRGSGAHEDVAIHHIQPAGDGSATGSFYAQPNHDTPQGTVSVRKPRRNLRYAYGLPSRPSQT
jgi:hypothetical protein